MDFYLLLIFLSGTKKYDLPVLSSLEDRCKQQKSVFMAYEDSCSKYIDCTLNSVEECPYPLLFDEDKKRCIHLEKANCGTRIVYKDPCKLW